ncbi:hypothetical protein EVAR_100160_1 [Eumeta japonica]|uniref:FHOD1 N-terminal GTPase-binding domain-containing protein n=1 Tax=Eumeta variegata TaxID=151549 RepID=A0A4C1ZR08_EUMVA|nr:hypothetical protein EVAR_100160_1 [Eumeta japonica]
MCAQLDDAALQVFKDGDYGPYLDLDSTLVEQEEDLEAAKLASLCTYARASQSVRRDALGRRMSIRPSRVSHRVL